MIMIMIMTMIIIMIVIINSISNKDPVLVSPGSSPRVPVACAQPLAKRSDNENFCASRACACRPPRRVPFAVLTRGDVP